MRKRCCRDADFLLVARAANVFRRGSREYGLGVYLLLAVLALRGESSSLALDRIMRQAGYRNARQYRHVALAETPQLIQYREDRDGKWWRVTEAGMGVLARVVRRIAEASSLAAKVERTGCKSQASSGDGPMLPGLFDGE